TQEQYEEATAFRGKIASEFDKLLNGNTVLCIPTTRDLPPLVGSSDEALLINRQETMKLAVIAPLARLPQVTLPVKLTEATTPGLSFVGGKDKDLLILNLCCDLAGLLL